MFAVLCRDFEEGPAVFAVPELLAEPEDPVKNQPKTYFHLKNEKNGPAMFAVLCRDFEEGPVVFAVPELLAEPEDHRKEPNYRDGAPHFTSDGARIFKLERMRSSWRQETNSPVSYG
ncbi:hypothetical protein SASPL_137356 [Salvia splendens]|uniref:Uncharacterized protein n=1 Tax=Salvia splendens TaxID=180675 RepID=A0A8X8WTI6_SALSN|nr:hypothetical protein SASPL_137356 [Salvia splendens]